MVINENNSQINSFVKGMNSDTSFDQVPNEQYILGQNIRITKNQLLGNSGEYSTVHEGIVTPVPSGVGCGGFSVGPDKKRILSVQSVDRLAIVVTTTIKIDGNDREYEAKDLDIYKFYMDETTNTPSGSWTHVWHCDNVWKGDVPEKISTVLYKELQNVIKLYIATGEHPIISLRVDDDSDGKYEISDGEYVSIDKLINNREIPTKRVFIDDVISGKLTTSQVQYTYRYYNKYGNTTQLAPLTNKIQVIDPSRTKEVGNAENTETSMGFALKIDASGYDLEHDYEKIQVFRLSYVIAGQDSEIALIYDGSIKKDSNGYFNLNDVGILPLQTYSIEEFSIMSGMMLIPQTIEQNQEYMFCANVKDDTILKDVERLPYKEGDAGYKLVRADVILSEQSQGDVPNHGNISYKDDWSAMTYWDDSLNRYVLDDDVSVLDYLEERSINKNIVKCNYDNIFTSSLLRSLRRGETYKYAIVFYDDKGRRTDVINLCDVDTLDYSTIPPFRAGNMLFAQPIGVKLTIPKLKIQKKDVDDINIIGCQVIRRSSSEIYQNNILQVALARPVSQALLDINTTSYDQMGDDTTKKSPFYPTGLLCVNDTYIYPTYYNNRDVPAFARWGQIYQMCFYPPLAARTRNKKLYQIFSSEIDFRRDDVLSKINVSDTEIIEVLYPKAIFSKYEGGTKMYTYTNYPTFPEFMKVDQHDDLFDGHHYLGVNRIKYGRITTDEKQTNHWVFNFYEGSGLSDFNNVQSHKINHIKDVKIPQWGDGFSEIIRTGDDQTLLSAIKKYKGFSTNIDEFTYNNWVSFCKYGLRAGQEYQPNVDYSDDYVAAEMLSDSTGYSDYITYEQATDDPEHGQEPGDVRTGPIGAGPSCFVLTTENEMGHMSIADNYIHTSICNITHNPRTTDVESDDYVQYFGFGNWFNLKLKNKEIVDGGDAECEYETENNKPFLTVFDGDVYITPHEFTTMYKAYDFNSPDTLQSTQIVNYVPLESKVNTCFDYGMNMINTSSQNLMNEPGYIDGVATQDRPVHQYNMIYSDNDASNDVFTLISTDKNETNEFRQRAYYSDLKNNGENIDNFLVFKPASFIDVDSRYGDITNLLTDKNTLYYWQDHACGKFSVNERSLVNDQNNNTIMLGQAGILSRYDYLSTKYGMRLHDFCARSVDSGGVFWVDINNKAIPAITGNGVVNYSENLNVQNIVNNKISSAVPYVDYDLQNDELLCKCLTDGDQLVFNTKYNIATSIYTRRYDDMLYIKNHLYGLTIHKPTEEAQNYQMGIRKHNYIDATSAYLTPMLLQFIVNPIASVTKVFDSQQLIPVKRALFTPQSPIDRAVILDNTVFSFETDIINKEFSGNMEPHTDREGNIIYNVPRYVTGDGYGNRIRGKWLRVNIQSTDPTELLTISHTITKFRQSYS